MGIYDRPYYQDEDGPSLAPSWDRRSAISTIIVACAAVFLANMIFTYNQNTINRMLTLHSEDLTQPWMLWRTITYGFAHSQDFTHILFNMLGLWMLGRPVEDRYGRAEFFRIYFVSLFICGLLWLVFRFVSGERASVCGASGAVCCIEMLFILNFPRSTLYLFGVLPIQAWVFGIFFILGNALTGTGSHGTEVAWDVHLVGIGCAVGYFFAKGNLGLLGGEWLDWRKWKRKLWGPRLRAFQPMDQSASDEAEADRILDKIHRFGQDSLTGKEKRFMTNYSKTVRNKRQNTSQ